MSSTTIITTTLLIASLTGGVFIFLQGFSAPTKSVSNWPKAPVVDIQEEAPQEDAPVVIIVATTSLPTIATTTPAPVVAIKAPVIKTSPVKTSTTTPVSKLPIAPIPTPVPVPQYLITLTDEGFSPKVITIKPGDTVTFLNKSSVPMWPAAATHPYHEDYPETPGMCGRGSTFDRCGGTPEGALPIGDSWSFKVNLPGSWKYHNHSRPAQEGVIVAK